jgi:hypothetical protein
MKLDLEFLDILKAKILTTILRAMVETIKFMAIKVMTP